MVGTRTTCPVKLTGHTSRYSEVELIVVDNGGGHTTGGQGMPCEFVPDKPGDWSPKDTCQNLPLPGGTVVN